MTRPWSHPELTGLGRLPMHSVAHDERLPLDGRWRFVVVADHSKWGVIGISSIARLDQADVLVTDIGITPEARAILSDAVRELVVVDPAPEAKMSLQVAHAR